MKLLFGPHDGREVFIPAGHDVVELPIPFDGALLSKPKPDDEMLTVATARYRRMSIITHVGSIDIFVYERVMPISIEQIIMRLIAGYRAIKPGRDGE